MGVICDTSYCCFLPQWDTGMRNQNAICQYASRRNLKMLEVHAWHIMVVTLKHHCLLRNKDRSSSFAGQPRERTSSLFQYRISQTSRELELGASFLRSCRIESQFAPDSSSGAVCSRGRLPPYASIRLNEPAITERAGPKNDESNQ